MGYNHWLFPMGFPNSIQTLGSSWNFLAKTGSLIRMLSLPDLQCTHNYRIRELLDCSNRMATKSHTKHADTRDIAILSWNSRQPIHFE